MTGGGVSLNKYLYYRKGAHVIITASCRVAAVLGTEDLRACLDIPLSFGHGADHHEKKQSTWIILSFLDKILFCHSALMCL